MKNIKITKVETKVLQNYNKTSPLILVRLKSQSVLCAGNGVEVEAICELVDKSESTVDKWLRDWRKQRLSSIFTGHVNNDNAAKLTKGQKLQIKQTFQQPPSEAGLPKEFWDVPQLKTYVNAEFGTVYESDKSYHFLLKFSSLSFKYPDKFDRKRDERFIIQRMQEIKQEITPLLLDPAWKVFSVDEVRMDQEAITRRAWLKKGQKTVLKVNRSKESQSYFGLLSQATFKCYLYEMDWQNSDEVLKVLKQFLKDNTDLVTVPI